MKILVVSPQPWDHIPLSKHNYAIGLARRGHDVIFLDPPDDQLVDASRLVPAREHPRLQILSYRRPWFYRLRFHLPRVFDWLMSRHIRRIMARHRCVPDLVWCFDFNLFNNLSLFGAKSRIFHPVDPLSIPRHIEPARSADLVLAVSSRIADQLAPAGKSVHVINHGLASPFADLARETLMTLRAVTENRPEENSPLQVGYAGNLCRRPVNRDILKQIVMEHPEVHFHFWGPAKDEAGIGADFIAFLQRQTHVTIHGAVSQEELASAYRGMDVFLLSYLADPRESDRSNSHKILEYMSSGKLIVSSRIQAYERCTELLVMSESETDADLPQLFAAAVAQLSELNSPRLQEARIAIALENTYDRQIDRILQLLEVEIKS